MREHVPDVVVLALVRAGDRRRCSASVTQRQPSVAFLATLFPAALRDADNPLFNNTGRCCSVATAIGTSLAFQTVDAGPSATRMLHYGALKFRCKKIC